ncbi:MAG: iron-containing alcohol dehydrogenase family protein [Planctomycetota bacterium]
MVTREAGVRGLRFESPRTTPRHIPIPAETKHLEFAFPTRLVHGADAVDDVGAIASGLGASRVLLVTDAGLVAAGHAARVRTLLADAGLACTLFDDVHENPTTDDVDRCLAAANDAQPDLVVALGGGSSMDCAKGCLFLLRGGGRMQDYWGYAKGSGPMLPLIVIPTTAGTGSETQSYALISDAATKRKMACGDPELLPNVAILDPVLATTQPRGVVSCAGLDTISHAVETLVTTRRNPISQMFSREAFVLGSAAFPRVLADVSDIDAQSDMMLAAALAGAAIENSMLGAAHALANPLTARYGITHGQAVGLMLPHVVRHNGADAEVAAAYASLHVSTNGTGATNALADHLQHLYAATELPTTLAACGVDRDAIPSLGADAAEQWTGTFNPRAVDAAALAGLYEQAFGG